MGPAYRIVVGAVAAVGSENLPNTPVFQTAGKSEIFPTVPVETLVGRGASRSQQQPESGFVDGGGSLSSWQSFQPAPGGSSINGGVPTGSSGKMEQHLKRPINRPGTVGSGNVYGAQGREFFMDSEGNVYEETPAPKSFFEELNIATVQSPSGGAPTTSAGGVGSRGGSPGGAPGVQIDPSRFYELSQAPTQEQQQLQQVLARGKSGLPHPFSRRSSAKRGSYDHEDLDSTAEIIMTKIESVTKARKQAAQARVPGFSFVKKVTSSSFGALENEKVYRRVMLPDGTHAIVPVSEFFLKQMYLYLLICIRLGLLLIRKCSVSL